MKEKSEHPLEDVLDEAIESGHGDTISLQDILDEFGTRSFGPVVVIISLVIISPIGSVPGLPIALGAAIVLLAAQIVFDRSHPWLPRRMLDTGFDKHKAEAFRDKAHGTLEKLDRLIQPRMEWATGRIALLFASLCLIFLSLTMVPLEFVPFAVTLPGAAMLIFGVGLTARDGLMMLIGFALTGSTFVLTFIWWPFGSGG
ncbi:MAG: exopolysaccharide biosynthesis protein [Parasphingopyxis sp.]|uniref:exopolysaccharide biosynthesis protein n=1 Tax=Parasphingopyxis sp. TaxID=1920299 RepID=UPI003FA0BF59